MEAKAEVILRREMIEDLDRHSLWSASAVHPAAHHRSVISGGNAFIPAQAGISRSL